MVLLGDPAKKLKGTPGAAAYSEYLKRVLHEHNVEFTVAPYSALAQVRPNQIALHAYS